MLSFKFSNTYPVKGNTTKWPSYLTCIYFNYRQELFGFQDIMAHLAGGYKVSFYMSGTDCNDPSSLPGEFHEPFGGNIDFYFQYKENDIFTAQFTMSKFDRNSEGN